MSTDTFATTDRIPRDRWGRPLVVPPDGGKPRAYTRTTTYVGCLEDTHALEKWKMRMTAIGLSDRADLQLAVTAHRDDKDRLNQIVDAAVEAARASAAATTGTALHALVDQYDRGVLDLARVPAAYRADIEAYAATTDRMESVAIEGFGVVDDIRVAGSWDRVYRLPDGRTVIGDTKTGSIEWGMGKIAMQLAVYAHATPYDHATGTRGTPNTDVVDQSMALVVHLPAGKGICHLVEVDIAAGWDAVALAGAVRAWRARKDLSRPHVVNRALTVMDPVGEAIAAAHTVEALTAVWAAHGAGRWTDAHTVLARARRALIEGGAV